MIAVQRLNRGMLSRYEIPEHRPDAVAAAQFGAGEALLGVVDRLIDQNAPGLGVACVAAGEAARALSAQDGMFTALVRGYEGDTPVRREVVVQSIVEAVDPEADFAAFSALALRPGLRLAFLDTASEGAEVALGLAARLLAERFRAGLGGLHVLCLGDDADCARRAWAFVARVASPWGLAGFERWLDRQNAFHPALAEGFAFRAEPAEAAKLCADMNYADALLHIAEPFARLTVEGDLPGVPAGGGIVCADDIAPAFTRKRRVFDAALCALAAPGWLLGCDTLAACMKHERLRAFAGSAVYRELLPALPMAREEAAAALIETFGRFENPLNDHRVLRAAHHLLDRLEGGVLPALRAYASEHFDVPSGLAFALAATVMLYAGARPSAERPGVWEVVRGGQKEAVVDDPERLKGFARLSHDMPPEALAYAALADRELWHGADLREIDGLEARVALSIAAMQRDPAWLPATDD